MEILIFLAGFLMGISVMAFLNACWCKKYNTTWPPKYIIGVDIAKEDDHKTIH